MRNYNPFYTHLNDACSRLRGFGTGSGEGQENIVRQLANRTQDFVFIWQLSRRLEVVRQFEIKKRHFLINSSSPYFSLEQMKSSHSPQEKTVL